MPHRHLPRCGTAGDENIPILILDVPTILIAICADKLGISPKLMPPIRHLCVGWPITEEAIPIRYLELLVIVHYKKEPLSRPSVAEVSCLCFPDAVIPPIGK
jgi:hypothetical protein